MYSRIRNVSEWLQNVPPYLLLRLYGVFFFSEILLYLNDSFVWGEISGKISNEWMKTWIIFFQVRWTVISEMFRRLLYLLKAVIPGSMKCCLPSSLSSSKPGLHPTTISSSSSIASSVRCRANVINSLRPKECISTYCRLAGWKLDIPTHCHAPHKNVV